MSNKPKSPEQRVFDAISRYHSRIPVIDSLVFRKKQLQKEIELLRKYQRKERAIIRAKGVKLKCSQK